VPDDSPKTLTILVLSGDMEKGLAACNLALAALASGRTVTLFFTFWGLNFLRRPGARARGPFLARFLSRVNGDDAARQRLGRFHMLGAGRWALLRLMGRYNLLPVRGGLQAAHQMGARILACSNTLQLMGLQRDDLIHEVDDVAGALGFLDAADEGTVVTLS
jgi:peroxiredoxin family protein